MKTNDPAVVRSEYADESRFAVRAAVWEGADGVDGKEIAFAAVAEVAPRRVLEVGPGRGELAERIARELGAEVIAIDSSERMVELTSARGVDARHGDVQALDFDSASFDCVVAAWMLYHVPDLDRALAEIARVLVPGGRLVAATNSERSLHELWSMLGSPWARTHAFSAENGEAPLLRRFARVERREANGTIRFASREAARAYVAASVTRAHLADDLPQWEGPLEATMAVSVFVAETAR